MTADPPPPEPRPLMKRLLPSPILSLSLLAIWLGLNQSMAVGMLLLGIFLAIALPVITRKMRPLLPKSVHRPDLILYVFLLMLFDIIQSAILVVGVILGPKSARQFSGFVKVPIDLKSPHAIAVLSVIMSMTSDSLWTDFNIEKSHLTFHVLNLRESEIILQTIKSRYEKPLQKIFR